MRVTSKGQVTIPAEIRASAGMLPGTEVEFIAEDDSVRLVRKAPKGRAGRRANAALRALRGAATVRLTTEQIMALTRSR